MEIPLKSKDFNVKKEPEDVADIEYLKSAHLKDMTIDLQMKTEPVEIKDDAVTAPADIQSEADGIHIPLSQPSTSRNFVCYVCGKKFPFLDALESHLKSRTNVCSSYHENSNIDNEKAIINQSPTPAIVRPTNVTANKETRTVISNDQSSHSKHSNEVGNGNFEKQNEITYTYFNQTKKYNLGTRLVVANKEMGKAGVSINDEAIANEISGLMMHV